MKKIFCFICLLFLCSCSIHKNTYVYRNNINVYGGQYTTESMGRSANISDNNYEENYLIAISGQRQVFDLPYNISIGGEVGTGHRFGEKNNQEFWGGVVLKHSGFLFIDVVISPSLIYGLSYVSDLLGEEERREKSNNGNYSLLFYLTPELEFYYPNNPQWSFFYRLHHRSGGNRTLGNACEGYNANTIGIKYKF